MVKHMIFKSILLVCGLILFAGCSGKTPGSISGEQEQQNSSEPTGASGRYAGTIRRAELAGAVGGRGRPGK